MKMWLARDGDDAAWYRVSTDKPKLHGLFWDGASNSHWFVTALWHQAGGLRLEPGEGPVSVDVHVVVKRIKKATPR